MNGARRSARLHGGRRSFAGAVSRFTVVSVLLAAVVAALILVAPLPAANAAGCADGGQTGIICVGENPGDPAMDLSTGLTPAPKTCVFGSERVGEYQELPCYDDISGWWSNAWQCYFEPQEAPEDENPPAGALPTGGWYTCALVPCIDYCWDAVWFNNPPPGITQLTPAAAAYQLLETIPLAPIEIGLAPDPLAAGSRSYVGVPVWMWADEPAPLTVGPYAVDETLGEINITATAHVTSIIWTMGDGSTVACATAGTPYQPSLGFAESPNCGHRYATVSTDQPNGRFPITATSQWTMDWAVGDVTGSLNTTRTANTSVEIRELQSVNVGN
jgi:hypothetical protein